MQVMSFTYNTGHDSYLALGVLSRYSPSVRRVPS